MCACACVCVQPLEDLCGAAISNVTIQQTVSIGFMLQLKMHHTITNNEHAFGKLCHVFTA